MLIEIIESQRDNYTIAEIYNKHYLNQCQRTSFTWSELPNTLCLAMNKKYFEEALNNPNIIGIIAPPASVIEGSFNKAVVISEKADELFYYLHNKIIHEITSYPYSFDIYIAPTAKIGSNAILGKQIYIGENVTIHDGCIILDNTVIKDNSVIYNNVTLGTQGFFSKHILGKKTHIEHYGGVQIGENCIIHTGTNISRSVNIGEYTTIGDNTHIGIHTNIGHDCKIGDNCDISAKVFLAGRVKLGSRCWIGGGAILSNSIRIGDNANIKIGSVVIEDVPQGAIVSGNFAIKHEKNLKYYLNSKE